MATQDMGVKSLRIAAEFFNNQRMHDEDVQLAIQVVNPLAKALGRDLTADAAWICRDTIATLVKSIQDGSFTTIVGHATLVAPLKKVWGSLAKMAPDADGNTLTHAAVSPEHSPNAQEGEHPEGGGAAYTTEPGESPAGPDGHADGVHPGGAAPSVAHSTGVEATMFPGGHGAPVHMYGGAIPVEHNAEHANEMIDAHNKSAEEHGDIIHSHAVHGGYDHNGNPTTSVVSHMTGADGSVMLHSKTDGNGVGSTACHMWGAHHEHASTKMAKSIGAKPAHHAARAALHKFHAHCAMMTGTPMGKMAGFDDLKKSWVNPKDGDLEVLQKTWSDAAREAAAAARQHGFQHTGNSAQSLGTHYFQQSGGSRLGINKDGGWVHQASDGVTTLGRGQGATALHEHMEAQRIQNGGKSLETHPLLKAGPAYYEILLKREFSIEKRKKLAASGAAMPDGSYPIENTGDLDNAIKAFGRSPDNATKAHIKKRAAALGASGSLPDNWK